MPPLVPQFNQQRSHSIHYRTDITWVTDNHNKGMVNKIPEGLVVTVIPREVRLVEEGEHVELVSIAEKQTITHVNVRRTPTAEGAGVNVGHGSDKLGLCLKTKVIWKG